MQKFELTKEGEQFHRSLRACLKWLSIGGYVEMETGHKIVMTEEGLPGFHANWLDVGDIILQAGSDTAWMFLVEHAKKMTDKEVISMLANVALNS